MADIVLIHGSCFGAWCWHRLIPALNALGHNARAIDLPRGGAHPATASLQAQADAILEGLRPDTLLLGHSAGGLPITAAAETDPSHIRALIWLCAYAPEEGSSVASLRRRQQEQPLRPAIRINRNKGSYSFDPAQADRLFFHDCLASDRALAAANLCPEAIAPQETPLRLTRNSQSLPRFYITCQDDRAIPPAFQHEMSLTVPPENRFTLTCGHAPFFAQPNETAALLHQIALRTG